MDPNVEPPGYEPPTSAEELLGRYATGERYFAHSSLQSARLNGAVLSEANLSYSDLGWAELENSVLDGGSFGETSFRYAALGKASLRDAYVRVADFHRAKLGHAKLDGSDFTTATFIWAAMVGSSATKADFTEANLTRADLTFADLSGANFWWANLSHIHVFGARFGGARFGFNELPRIGLAGIEDLATRHGGPSSVAVDTLHLTASELRKYPERQGQVEEFLRGCGLSRSDVEYFRTLIGSPLEFYSAFISHSSTDKPFARRLFEALQARGIRCWFDEHSMVPGDDLHESINKGVRLYDKLILVCSESSLKGSWWVDSEITTALEKEQKLMKERGDKVLALIPLDLDGYLFDGDVHGKAATIRSRVAGDFKGWDTDEEKFQRQLERLVRALRADSGGRDEPSEGRL